MPDKDEVSGSSPGRPTTHPRRSQRCRQRAGGVRCPAWAALGPHPHPRRPLPWPLRGHPPARPSASATTTQRGHAPAQRRQPRVGCRHLALRPAPAPPRSRPPPALHTPARPGWSRSGKRGRRGPHPPGGPGPHRPPLTTPTPVASPASRPPRPSVEPSTARQPPGPPPVLVVRSPGHRDPGSQRHRRSMEETDASGPTGPTPDGWTPTGGQRTAERRTRWTTIPGDQTPDGWTAGSRTPNRDGWTPPAGHRRPTPWPGCWPGRPRRRRPTAR
jgi:hypothetical protein